MGLLGYENQFAHLLGYRGALHRSGTRTGCGKWMWEKQEGNFADEKSLGAEWKAAAVAQAPQKLSKRARENARDFACPSHFDMF